LAGEAVAVRWSASTGARLALQFFLVAAAVTAICGWATVALVRTGLEAQLRWELDRMTEGVDAALEGVAAGIEDSFDAIEDYLRGRDPRMLETLLLEREGSADAAGLLMAMADLDSLEILNGAGEIISSGRWPQRAGMAGPEELLSLPAGAPVLRTLPEPHDERLGFLLTREMSVGSRMLTLAGGMAIGERFVELIAGGEAALLLDGSGRLVAASSRAAGLNPNEPDSAPWLVGEYSLPDGAGTVHLAVHRGEIDPLVGTVRNAFLLIGLFVSLASALAGLWVARRISRPVNELVRAFDDMATGEADYTFPVSRQHELQELVTSVSRLHRALEAQRQRSIAAERIATWRDVARVVAHEVKNPLVPISLTAENLLRARREAPERFDGMFREGMETIKEEVEQLRRLVEEFSSFARMPQPDRRPEDLEKLLDSVVELYRSEPGVRIERRRAGDLPPLGLDADQISRAFKNVLGNAIEAMREAQEGAAETMAMEVSTALDGDTVVVEFADSGPGLTGEAERRLFEPYFTTKSGGTGLGMALTYRIVVEHGGTITAENRDGGGARVSIRLPARPEHGV
jgi:signal transduction histidine kinase